MLRVRMLGVFVCVCVEMREMRPICDHNVRVRGLMRPPRGAVLMYGGDDYSDSPRCECGVCVCVCGVAL